MFKNGVLLYTFQFISVAAYHTTKNLVHEENLRIIKGSR